MKSKELPLICQGIFYDFTDTRILDEHCTQDTRELNWFSCEVNEFITTQDMR